jgi:hypothetical protein
MKRFHLAIGVKNITESIKDYTKRLNIKPEVVIDEEYALFRTSTLNLSIRKVSSNNLGFRHVGWESDDYDKFSEEKDCNGLIWETFNSKSQRDEINSIWP